MKKIKSNMISKLKSIMMALVIVSLAGAMIPPVQAKAASGAAYVGSASGETGSEVTISLSLSSDVEIGAASINLSYDSSYIEFVSGSDMSGGAGTISAVYSDTFSGTLNKSFTVKILKPGTSYISVLSSSYMVSMEGDKVQVSGGSGTVTGNAPYTASTDNTLASLSISPGTLSPAFSPNVTTYTASVGADCQQLVVSAVANDSRASVYVSGTRMDPGDNTTTITVTAESGATKTYTIYTKKAEAETEATTPGETEGETEPKEETVKVDGITYKIITDLESHPLPSGYEAVDYEYNETIVKAGKGVNTKLILMYLESTDDKGTSGFYIYDSVAKTFTLYSEVAQPEITYVILPITDSMEKPADLVMMDYKINDRTVKVMMSSDRSYCVFYGVSSTGVTGWFRYDCKDKTIQVYSAASNNQSMTTGTETVVKQDSSLKIWKIIAFAGSGTAFILVIVVIVLAVKLSKSKKNAAFGTSDVYSADNLEEENLDTIMYEDEEDVLDEEDALNEEDALYEEDALDEAEISVDDNAEDESYETVSLEEVNDSYSEEDLSDIPEAEDIDGIMNDDDIDDILADDADDNSGFEEIELFDIEDKK